MRFLLGWLLLLGCHDDPSKHSSEADSATDTATPDPTETGETEETGPSTRLVWPIADVTAASVSGPYQDSWLSANVAWEGHLLATLYDVGPPPTTYIGESGSVDATTLVLSLPDLQTTGRWPALPDEDNRTSPTVAKDIDLDGTVEILFRQLNLDSPYEDSAGAVRVVHGLPDGDAGLSDTTTLVVYGPEQTNFGFSADFAALGSDPSEIDLVVGALGSEFLVLQGGVWAFDPQESGDRSWRDASRSIRGASPFGAYFCAPDLDGDGSLDLATNGADGIRFFAGPWETDLEEEDHEATWTGESPYEPEDSLTVLRDIDGDGYDELAFSATDYSDPEVRTGRAYIVYGGQRPAGETPADDLPGRFEGREYVEGMGADIDIGDIDGDGQTDLVIGAAHAEGASVAAGRVLLYLGPVSAAVRTADDADICIEGESEGDVFGRALVVTDADGDGRDDIVATAPLAPNLTHQGVIYLVTASSLGL